MKYATILAALATTATALTILKPEHEQAVFATTAEEERSLIEFGPGETRWVTDDDKWALKRVSLQILQRRDSSSYLVWLMSRSGGYQLHGHNPYA